MVIYMDGSMQMPERVFGVEDQRSETGYVAVITTRSPQTEELKVIEIKKGTCRGRTSNFDVETVAIREAMKWAKQNKVEDMLIRSDSTAVI